MCMDPQGLEDLLEAVAGEEELFSERDSTPENIDHVPVDDIVSVYFRQMAAEPLLTAEQEVALAKRIERGIEAQKYLDTMYDELAQRTSSHWRPWYSTGRLPASTWRRRTRASW